MKCIMCKKELVFEEKVSLLAKDAKYWDEEREDEVVCSCGVTFKLTVQPNGSFSTKRVK